MEKGFGEVLQSGLFHSNRICPYGPLDMEKLLLVDDDAKVRNLISVFLGEAGFEVVTAESGDQALQKPRENGIELVISDIDLKDLPGIELLGLIREINEWIPVILISASEDETRRDRAIRLGASGYLSKPFELDCLLAMVKKAFAEDPEEGLADFG
jgi:DNA-binding response OmpR family regulator